VTVTTLQIANAAAHDQPINAAFGVKAGITISGLYFRI
jgi:hypothetical protein